jgi:hypothetical protein
MSARQISRLARQCVRAIVIWALIPLIAFGGFPLTACGCSELPHAICHCHDVKSRCDRPDIARLCCADQLAKRHIGPLICGRSCTHGVCGHNCSAVVRCLVEPARTFRSTTKRIYKTPFVWSPAEFRCPASCVCTFRTISTRTETAPCDLTIRLQRLVI